jgi:hypothetical protein
MNVSIINWIVLFLGIAIVFTPWRTLSSRSMYIESAFSLVLFSLWFYLFYFLIF